jgi:hypothetical protein
MHLEALHDELKATYARHTTPIPSSEEIANHAASPAFESTIDTLLSAIVNTDGHDVLMTHFEVVADCLLIIAGLDLRGHVRTAYEAK